MDNSHESIRPGVDALYKSTFYLLTYLPKATLLGCAGYTLGFIGRLYI